MFKKHINLTLGIPFRFFVGVEKKNRSTIIIKRNFGYSKDKFSTYQGVVVCIGGEDFANIRGVKFESSATILIYLKKLLLRCYVFDFG